MVKNFDTSGSKLAPSYRGLYRVKRRLKNDRYIVTDIEGCQISQTLQRNMGSCEHETMAWKLEIR